MCLHVQSTLDVTVSVPEPLLSDGQRSDSNVLMVTVETMYSVPEVWNPASTPPSSYVAALQIPASATVRHKCLCLFGISSDSRHVKPLVFLT